MTTYSNAALHVAHGNGLSLPLTVTTTTQIGRKSRESSAPPFLRRDPKELARLDAGPQPARERAQNRNLEAYNAARKAAADERKAAGIRRPHRRTGNTPGPNGRRIDEAALIADYQSGMGQRALAKKYRVWDQRIVEVLDAAGIERRKFSPNRKKDYTPTQRQRVADAYRNGASIKAAGASIGTGQRQALRILNEAGVPIRPANGADK